MRAGLLSDARVVVALRTLFVPVHITALNTAHCMHDARDVELLTSMAGDGTDRFQGGEREAFVLPDGRMQRVFLSLNGHDVGGFATGVAQYTAAGRRSDDGTRMFRHHGAIALRDTHGEVPVEWRSLWDGNHPDLVPIASEAPRWPEPAPGRQGLRVFVRNSYRMYDDLHGSQLVLLADDVVAAWTAPLTAPESRAQLPSAQFDALARAIVPRGQVDTELATASIHGRLTLVARSVDGEIVTGDVTGTFSLRPTDLAEAGKRPSAAALFESKGTLTGRFTFDRALRTFRELRVVATGVEYALKSHWDPGGSGLTNHAPRHQIAIEWVRTQEAAR